MSKSGVCFVNRIYYLYGSLLTCKSLATLRYLDLPDFDVDDVTAHPFMPMRCSRRFGKASIQQVNN